MAARYTSYLSPRDWAKPPSIIPRKTMAATAKVAVDADEAATAIAVARAKAKSKATLHRVVPKARAREASIVAMVRASERAMPRRPSHKHNTRPVFPRECRSFFGIPSSIFRSTLGEKSVYPRGAEGRAKKH